ncbi:MAG: hypothetical protein ACXW27_05920 [Allosphingosinicella sp.]
MLASREVVEFIRSHFRSVWSLELLLHLRRHPDRFWSTAELVEVLRASQAVVATGIETLLAGGLIVVQKDGGARYAPASPDLDERVGETEEVYGRKPDAVRRLIVLSANSGVTAFADAFRLRRD